MFNSFLIVLHLGEDNNLSDLLVFTTGLDAIPLLGIKPSPTLQFDHPEDGVDDEVCRLLTRVQTPCTFRSWPITSYSNSGCCWHWRPA